LIPVRKKPVVENPPTEDQVTAKGEAPEEAPEQKAEDECRQLLQKKEQELKEAQDRILRLAAEMDNTRKRLEREKSEGISYANESIVRQLIEVIDNLERAVEHGESGQSCDGLLDGVRMTLKNFFDVLARSGAVPFESVGSAFDPNLHEAVLQEESTDCPNMTVTREFQKGYMLRERLLRPARVAVARNTKENSC
jgi:molecular chaperone GrpE